MRVEGKGRERGSSRDSILYFVAALLVLATTVGCSGAAVDLSCSAFSPLVVEANPANLHSALVRVGVSDGRSVLVEYGEAGQFDRRTPEQAPTTGEGDGLLVLGLLADAEYTMRVVTGDGACTSEAVDFRTEPLPDGWPACTVTAAAGAVFDDDEGVCSHGRIGDDDPYWFCVDRAGRPVWVMRHPDGEGLQLVQTLSDGSHAALGASGSFLALFDRSGWFTRQYSPLWFEGRTRFVHDWIDVHDVIEVTEGPWAGAVAFLTATIDVVDSGERNGIGLIVFDRQGEDVLWDWSIHGELGDGVPIDPIMDYDRYGLFEEGGARHWNHGNALLHGVDGQGRQYFWISLRAQDWIVRVEVETDAISWRLGHEGDFEWVNDLDGEDPVSLEPRQWMFQQHSPEWQQRQGERTRFLVYDNGVARPGPDGVADQEDPHSRILEIEIDEASRRATLLFEYGTADPESDQYFYSAELGDADMLPGGSAVLFNEGLGDPWAAEISYPGGEETWRLHCPELPRFYRMDYFPSLYETTWWYEVER